MDSHHETQKPQIIKLCGVQGCCPTVEVHDSKLVITDDDGGRVTLTKEQWKDAVNNVRFDK